MVFIGICCGSLFVGWSDSMSIIGFVCSVVRVFVCFVFVAVCSIVFGVRFVVSSCLLYSLGSGLGGFGWNASVLICSGICTSGSKKSFIQ